MDKEKRAADWPIKPGQIVIHTSDGDGMSPDVGIEVGLSSDASLYIGEVSLQTLAEHGIKFPGGWWICISTAKELLPLALPAGNGGEAEELAQNIARAIREADDLTDAYWRGYHAALTDKQGTPRARRREMPQGGAVILAVVLSLAAWGLIAAIALLIL